MSHRNKTKAKGSPLLIAFIVIVLLIGLFAPKKGAKRSQPNDAAQSDSSAPQPPEGLDVENTAPVRLPPDAEQLEQSARTYLAEEFQLDLDSFRVHGGFEATISVPGVSDQSGLEWAPENWEEIQLSLISAQARLSEALEMPDTPSVVLVKDAAGELLLSVQQGRIAYNALKPEPELEPEPTDSQPSVSPSQQQTTSVYVLNTSTKRFHLFSCSSVEKIAPENYSTYSGTRSGVIGMGYTPCGNCHP